MKGFNTKMQAVCSVWCILALFLSFVATILVHMAFSVLITPLVTLPANLRTGINEALQFSHLDSGCQAVRSHSQTALAKCNVVPTMCTNLPVVPFGNTSDTTTELTAIHKIFDDTLAIIEKVANDAFLGQGDFKVLANDLAVIRTELDRVKNQTQPIECRATNDVFCKLYKESNDILSKLGQVQFGIDKLTNSPEILEFEEQAQRGSNAFNGLPYIMWVCVLFYGCFWYSNRPSCKGGMGPCMACCCHALFFTIAMIISLVFVAAGIVVTKVVAEVKLSDPFQGQPTIGQLVDHIQVEFPGFYRIVLQDLLDGMKKIYSAYVVFLIAQIMLLCHTCSCCCGLYINEEKASG